MSELSETARKKLIALTDSEKFIFSLGEMAREVEPALLEAEPTRRLFVRVGGKIIADMAAGEGDVDFSKIDFQLFLSEYKRLQKLIV